MPDALPRDHHIADLPARLLRRIVIGYMAFLCIALLLGSTIPAEWPIWLTFRLLIQQDAWLIAAQCMIGALVLQPRPRFGRIPDLSGWKLVLVATMVALGCYAGFYFVLGAYNITRDEQMAAFDSVVFAHGRLAWPIPAEWQPDAAALNTLFMLPVEQPAAWISAYLPGNSALRALVSFVADPALTGPLLTAGTLFVLLSCARKIWPDDRETQTVSLLLLLGSGQVVLMGMSSFAMPAHLFCNLVWLRLFLADRRGADLAAVALGALATGLHQPLFHPLFVAPFMLTLLLDRRWSRLAILVPGYLAVGLFWMAWPLWMTSLVSGPESIPAGVGADFLSRLIDALAANSHHLALTAANLLRFCTWQHLLTIPLMIAGLIAMRANRLTQALALGIFLPAVVLAAILPWQGNGFGYRYLHGVIGNSVLLAGFGWRWLVQAMPDSRSAFVKATLGTILVLMPMQIWFSYLRYAPFAAADRQIDATGADYLLLQAGNGASFGNLVINRPDLSNRPIRLMAEYVRDHRRLARRICKPGVTVAVAGNRFFHAGMAYFRSPPQDTAEARLPALRAPYEQAGCRIIVMQQP